VHVVFGTGQVGAALSARLAASGVRVRGVSRHPPRTPVDGVEWRAMDVTDPAAAAGASVVYQCLNAPCARWPERFPPLQRAAMAAAQRADALLVSFENVDGYGPTGGRPMTEDLPLAATTTRGRVRAAMAEELLAAHAAGRVRVAIGRASDFFGPGVRDSALGERLFRRALAGKRIDVLGDPDLPHTYSYVPDIVAGLAVLGTDPRAEGNVWHLPGPETVTTRAVLDLVATVVGRPVPVRAVSQRALRALGLVSPVTRGLTETAYQFEESFVLDTAKFESTFSTTRTDLAPAISDTLAWYRP
jgi:nucleoside-diphosphate-sugar epimerase